MSTEIDKMVKAIVWDLDGTLLDSFEIFADILIDVALANKLEPPSREELHSNFHGSMEQAIQGVFALSDSQKELLSKLHADFLKDQVAYYEHPNEHLFADGLDLAQRAKNSGLTQIIVTNRLHHDHGTASPRHIVEHSDLKALIEHIICRDEGLYFKPDGRILDDFLAASRLRADELVVIGDQHIDAELALNAGSKAILVNRHDQPIPRLGNLPNWQATVKIVKSLRDVVLL